MAEIEVGFADFNKFPALAKSTRHAATLSEATSGDLNLSRRHRELREPNGFGDELRAALVTNSKTWGGITLLRNREHAGFDSADARLVESLASEIAQGLRRAVARETLDGGIPPDLGPGVVILEHDNSIASTNAAADVWLRQLAGETDTGALPPPDPVIAVASRARAVAAGRPGPPARIRLRTGAGHWLVVHGSVLSDPGGGRSVVTIEPAHAPDLAPLVADAYGLTERERAVTQLVAQGVGTNAIAERLFLSPWTVQDHLKAIFEKTGVRTRGQLVARLFIEHPGPRLTS
jgi:DNA-binding CsgD family transcriptional regulator